MASVRPLLAAVLAGSLAAPPPAIAQSSPAPLTVYSDEFSAGTSTTAAPGSAQRGTTLVVDVAAVAQLDADTTALEARLSSHVADGGAHQPHGHPPHTHCPPGTQEASATPILDRPPGPSTGAPDDDSAGLASAAQPNDDHCGLLRLLDTAISLLARSAYAQQPPPLNVYDEDMSGPSQPAPASSRNVLEPTVRADVPLVDQLRRLIREVDLEITAHVADRPGHGHSHPH